jgi:hypothetical protein
MDRPPDAAIRPQTLSSTSRQPVSQYSPPFAIGTSPRSQQAFHLLASPPALRETVAHQPDACGCTNTDTGRKAYDQGDEDHQPASGPVSGGLAGRKGAKKAAGRHGAGLSASWSAPGRLAGRRRPEWTDGSHVRLGPQHVYLIADHATDGLRLSVTVRFDGSMLTFQHDGPSFRDEEIAYLIFHGSTKYDDHVGLGRFGTGFISTHLLSRIVRIRGPLDGGTMFDFDLDRTGHDARAVERSLERSWEAMNASSRVRGGSDADRWTTFAYPIGPDTETVVQHGLRELSRTAPLVLAFNPQFSSLSIQADAATGHYTFGRG